MEPDSEDKILVLNIPDYYHRGDPHLVSIIKNEVSIHLEALKSETE